MLAAAPPPVAGLAGPSSAAPLTGGGFAAALRAATAHSRGPSSLTPATPSAGAPAPGRLAPGLASASEPPALWKDRAPADLARQALETIDCARLRLDAALQAARAGRTFTPGELLGLQSQAYRLSQTVDVAARVVEGGAQTIRQALNAPA